MLIVERAVIIIKVLKYVTLFKGNINKREPHAMALLS